ncbi:MAG: hypothetical protein MIO92_02015 [Methanosarcinaceae archaeon]|nr:hypothetical protein [Methanosarcinaceae archaeon]
MGHDVIAYKNADKGHENEVAYLRRASWDNLSHTIYKALQSRELAGERSGCSAEKLFSRDNLKDALTRVPDREDTEREREFLRKCINAGKDGVRIVFC